MTTSADIWHSGKKDLIWDRFCGHFYLTPSRFMAVQEVLLLQQLDLLPKCELGRKLLGGKTPKTVEGFRSQVPLTTYSDYEPYLLQRKGEALPAKPYIWMRASGPGGTRKWVPLTQKMHELLLDTVLELFILASSTGEGRFSVKPGDVILNTTPPLSWFAGVAIRETASHFGFRLIPPPDEAFDKATLPEKSSRAFQMALHTGLDIMMGVSSILVKMGEEFSLQKPSPKSMANPRALAGLLSGKLKTFPAKRGLLPKDLWRIKAIIAGGADTAIFKQKIIHYWGTEPLEIFPNTEFSSYIGTLTWGKTQLTFQPYSCFLEFIPKAESASSSQNSSIQENTVLLDQVKAGEIYEVVFTTFHGGAFVRYRNGDLIKITMLEDEKTGIKLPHFVANGRADKLINIAGFTRIDERTIWLAMERTGIAYNDWLARKEIEGGLPVLHIYLDVNTVSEPGRARKQLHESLSNLDRDYNNIEEMLGQDPLRLTLLPKGTLLKWKQEHLKDGRDLAWINDQRMQASDEVMEKILEISARSSRLP